MFFYFSILHRGLKGSAWLSFWLIALPWECSDPARTEINAFPAGKALVEVKDTLLLEFYE